ncbi:thioredoxin family protein [Calidifontibacillus erzurumensis]|uniref:Thioredoxin family protein n=1 Tax=Calidifontibacillus erzurumensis TaxID=2741433 RepID=A0A8J8GFK6_9BACI|nr:thioredoxin family protein [Calidifontibacillus erzurumensis]NSL50878.1 thioredoxin family protein [Calidifontibacillus erzurumensis]
MKKIIIFGVIIFAIFVSLGILTNMKNKELAEGNPYNKETLHPATIDQLDDPLYQNLIMPDELSDQLKNNGTAFIYFYSPTCEHCRKATPIVVPMAKELGINLQLFNLLEFEFGWDDYKINGTPTIIYFENGKESARIEGSVEAEQFKQWFLENK